MKFKYIYQSLLLISALLAVSASIAQSSVGINTKTPNSNAVLHLVSPNNNQGFLVPQLSTNERIATTFTSTLAQNAANNGLLVFDTDLNSFFYWETSTWKSILADNLAEVLKAGNNAGSIAIKGLADPIDAQDAVTKIYVDDTLQRILVHIEEIENIVNDNSTNITEISENITEIQQKQIEYWDSIVNHSEHFKTLFDSIYSYDEHFNEYWDSILVHSEKITTLFDSIYVYRDYFTEIHDSIFHHSELITTLFDSIYVYRDYFTEIHDSIYSYHDHFNEYWDSITRIKHTQKTLFDSITRIQKIFEKAEFNLPNGQVYIGNADDKASAHAISGDVLLSTTGETTIQQNTIGENELDKANIALSGFATPGADIALGDASSRYRITNLGIPADPNDATTKQYVDDTVGSLVQRINDNTANDANDISRLNYLYSTGKFALPGGYIVIGNNDSAHAVPVSGDIIIDSTSGVATITPEAVGPIDLAGIVDSGAVGQILVSKGDGTFEWQGKFSGGMSDVLPSGNFWTGDATNKAQPVTKSSIPLSGFGNAASSVSMGDGTLNYRIENVANPQALQDAATKAYVDSGSSAINTSLAKNLTNDNTLRDSLRYVIKNGKIALQPGYIFIGHNDTANAVPLSGHIAINSATGVSTIQDASILSKNLTTTGNTALGNGTSGQVLSSDGSGRFVWATNEIQDLSINGTNLKITNNTLASTIALGNIRLDQLTKPNGTIDMNSQRITGLATPTANTDAANKKYIDSISTTINTKLNTGSLTEEAVPVWSGTKLTDSKIWSNGTNITIGGTKPLAYSYDCEINGSFKTQKIYHSSDKRWKKNIATLDSALAKVLQMNGVEYTWRKDEFPEKNFPSGIQIGLIAQEIEQIVPEVVNTDQEGYKAVEYANLVAYLIEAMKEQQNIIEEQRLEINQLQKQNSNFESRLENIEKALLKNEE